MPVEVPRLWANETCVILGGGSSLTWEDCAFVGDKAKVIAIKEAGCCAIPGDVAPAPWADVLYAADEKYWRFVNGAPDFMGLKYSIEDWPVDDRNYKPAILAARRQVYPNVVLLRNAGAYGLELNPCGLRTGYNSGYQAINLAVHFGVRRIVLLGFDMWAGANGRQNWFAKHPTHLDSQYALFLQAFATIAEPLKAAGVEVLNCSRFTVLSVFPRVPLEEVIW
jgi:hypothetical protein